MNHVASMLLKDPLCRVIFEGELYHFHSSVAFPEEVNVHFENVLAIHTLILVPVPGTFLVQKRSNSPY